MTCVVDAPLSPEKLWSEVGEVSTRVDGQFEQSRSRTGDVESRSGPLFGSPRSVGLGEAPGGLKHREKRIAEMELFWGLSENYSRVHGKQFFISFSSTIVTEPEVGKWQMTINDRQTFRPSLFLITK